VECQLDVLRKCIRLDGLTKKLNSLPKTLEATYDQILQNIDDEYHNDVFKVLQWLAFSACPMTLAEVAEALAVDFTNNQPQFDPDQWMPDPQDILVMCSSMVTTSSYTFTSKNEDEGDANAREEEGQLISGTGKLRLAHFSVKEYLIGKQIQNGPGSQYSFNENVANNLISQTCLAYLLQFDTIGSLKSTTLSCFPLARYAAEFWIHHAQMQSQNSVMPNTVQCLIMSLLQPQSAQFINWV
jgi:hypothetical protein